MYLHACQVRVTVGHSGLLLLYLCYVFRALTPFCVDSALVELPSLSINRRWYRFAAPQPSPALSTNRRWHRFAALHLDCASVVGCVFTAPRELQSLRACVALPFRSMKGEGVWEVANDSVQTRTYTHPHTDTHAHTQIAFASRSPCAHECSVCVCVCVCV